MASPLLVQYVNQFLEDHDADHFQRLVGERYTAATLSRLVQSSNDLRMRRAAALALGLIGSIESNEVLATALHDDDDIVREWAERSLWMIWFRASDAEHNERLQTVAGWLADDRPKVAVQHATELIEQAPDFAEAYNQRAIGYWRMGMWDDAIRDCERVLNINPRHFGAAAGMGQCFLQQGDLRNAVACFERALDINPNLEGVAEMLEKLRDEIV